MFLRAELDTIGAWRCKCAPMGAGMINFGSETTITLREAAARLPRRRGGKRAHVATLYRWAMRGIRGVRLETIQVGGNRCTSTEALQRFFERLTSTKDGVRPSVTRSGRAVEQQAARTYLDQIGD